MLIALRTAVALFATARPNHFRMIRSKTLPEALNGSGSMSSPRTLCDLNLDYQTALCRYQRQPSIVLRQALLVNTLTACLHLLLPPIFVSEREAVLLAPTSSNHGGLIS